MLYLLAVKDIGALFTVFFVLYSLLSVKRITSISISEMSEDLLSIKDTTNSTAVDILMGIINTSYIFTFIVSIVLYLQVVLKMIGVLAIWVCFNEIAIGYNLLIYIVYSFIPITIITLKSMVDSCIIINSNRKK